MYFKQNKTRFFIR